jgi:PAS domain S-box-containing protein
MSNPQSAIHNQQSAIHWTALLSSTYARIIFGMLLIGAGYLLLFSYFGVSSADRLVDLRREELKRLTYMGVNVIQPVLDQQRRGELTEAQALAQGRDLIRRMRYMYGLGANYLFMGSRFGQVLAQPSDPQMEGSNQLGLTDAEGRFITREFIQVADSAAGEGYVEYHETPPGGDRPQLKIAYVVGIPDWEAYIGTAMHLTDLDAENQAFARNSLLLTGGLFGVVFLAVFFVLRPVFSSYHTLLGVFDQIRRNPEAVPSVHAERYPSGSEGRQLLSGFRDMLQQVQFSRQQVKDSEERFSLAVQGTDDGIWDWQVKTNTVYYSPRWKEMIGYADDELPNRFEEWSVRLHPDDLDATMQALNDHLAGQTPFFEREIRIRHKDGAYRWILTRGATVRDAAGRPVRMAGSQSDITERRRVSAELIEREAQYRSIFEATTDGLIISRLDGTIVEANPAACDLFGYSYAEFIRLPPQAIIHPDHFAGFQQYLRVVGGGQPVSTHSVTIRKDGVALEVEVRGTLITYRGEPHVLSMVHDVTERVRAFQLLEERVEERTRELSTLLDISHSMTSTFELKPLLRVILSQLKTVVNYTGATLFTLHDHELTILDYQGPIPPDQILPLRFPLARAGVNQRVIHGRAPLIIADVRGRTPEAAAFQQFAGDELLTTYGYIRSWLGVPLIAQERVVGMLSLDHDEPDHYTARDAQLALAIANQAAIAIENSRLYWQAKELAALEERNRLARELHDSVSQALYGIALGARTARTQLDRDPAKAKEPLDYTLQLAEAGLAEMRALIFELRPESLKTDGLVAALTKQAEAVRARHHLDVQTDFCEEIEPLPLDAKEVLYRITQEALHNIVKHAKATRVDLKLACESGSVAFLEIADNGVGFDAQATFPGHLGLKSMRERALRVGGGFSVKSEPGAGTRLRVRIPFKA